jgi:hypothetical protein
VARFLIAFDDSGGIEPLCDWAGDPIAGDHPLTVLTGVFIDRAVEDEFTQNWNAPRARIGKELGTDPPPIHLRLMWGRSLPTKYRRSHNPYLGTDFAHIMVWVGEALEIYRGFAKRRAMGAVSVNRVRAEAAESHTRFLKDKTFRAEMAFIRKRAGEKAYKGYHNAIVSPLIPLYTRILPGVNELMFATRSDGIDVLIDSFADAHGIDAVEVVTEMKRVANLSSIGTVARVSDSDQQPLVQAADLLGFVLFRRDMAANRFMAEDLVVRGLLEPPLPMNSITNANVDHIVRRKYPDLWQRTLAMEYALARSRLLARAREFVDRHLVSVDEFFERTMEATRTGAIGVSVLKSPEMAKAPD